MDLSPFSSSTALRCTLASTVAKEEYPHFIEELLHSNNIGTAKGRGQFISYTLTELYKTCGFRTEEEL
eukprot:3413064-Ditylum_brightwellii.AAC.1